MDKLSKMLEFQAEVDTKLYGRPPELMNTEKMLEICRAISHEVMELEDELKWKWWEDKMPRLHEAKEEFIDIFIFMLGLANALKMDVDEIMQWWRMKTMKNIEREKVRL